MRLSLLLLAGWIHTIIASSVDSIVNLSNGTMRGNARDSTGILSFQGIPFAAPQWENIDGKLLGQHCHSMEPTKRPPTAQALTARFQMAQT